MNHRATGEIDRGNFCARIPNPVHQAIDAPGDGLRISARSSEDDVIEAIENTPGGVGGYVLGVQWHPERTFYESPTSRALFARFIAEAEAWKPKPQEVGESGIAAGFSPQRAAQEGTGL